MLVTGSEDSTARYIVTKHAHIIGSFGIKIWAGRRGS